MGRQKSFKADAATATVTRIAGNSYRPAIKAVLRLTNQRRDLMHPWCVLRLFGGRCLHVVRAASGYRVRDDDNAGYGPFVGVTAALDAIEEIANEQSA